MSDKKERILVCPVCKGESTEKYNPFCSKRCADVDLNRWLVGGYRFPTDERAIATADDDEII